jgi:hypothetical protein
MRFRIGIGRFELEAAGHVYLARTLETVLRTGPGPEGLLALDAWRCVNERETGWTVRAMNRDLMHSRAKDRTRDFPHCEAVRQGRSALGRWCPWLRLGCPCLRIDEACRKVMGPPSRGTTG